MFEREARNKWPRLSLGAKLVARFGSPSWWSPKQAIELYHNHHHERHTTTITKERPHLGEWLSEAAHTRSLIICASVFLALLRLMEVPGCCKADAASSSHLANRGRTNVNFE